MIQLIQHYNMKGGGQKIMLKQRFALQPSSQGIYHWSVMKISQNSKVLFHKIESTGLGIKGTTIKRMYTFDLHINKYLQHNRPVILYYKGNLKIYKGKYASGAFGLSFLTYWSNQSDFLTRLPYFY